jgi:hypothetical protein
MNVFAAEFFLPAAEFYRGKSAEKSLQGFATLYLGAAGQLSLPRGEGAHVRSGTRIYQSS